MNYFQLFCHFGLTGLSVLPIALVCVTGIALENNSAFSAELPKGLDASTRKAPTDSASIPRLRDFDRPSTSASILTQAANPVQITAVEIQPTQTGIEIQLVAATPLQATTRIEGNTIVATINNAVLAQPAGFSRENPSAEISSVQVVQATPTHVQVRITGKQTVPIAQIKSGPGLVLAITPDEGQEEEITVTGQGQRGYRVPNSSTATKTDTPIRDIPQSIQVVPRQLLEDRQVTRIEQVADNVPGVQPLVSYGGIPTASFFIRGFANNSNVYRDGFREFNFVNRIDIAGIEQIEFLKGPASVLYGQNEPGGLVNIVSKQPLQNPYYSPSLTIGSFDFYRGTLDLSSPLNPQKTAAYRLNLAYENAGSFRDFVDSKSIFVAPAFSLQLGPNTKLTFNFEYQNYNYTFDRGFPVEPEVFKVPISRFLGEPGFDDATVNFGRASYVLEHQFNETWKLRHGFAASIGNIKESQILARSLQADRRTFNRDPYTSDETQRNYTLQNELVGKFRTGSIAHQLLLGVELFRYRFDYTFRTGTVTPINLFNPVYGAKPENFSAPSGNEYGSDGASFYFQDQVTLLNNLKLLLGGRFDVARTVNAERPSNVKVDDTTDFAFSPRAGIVYQPIEPLSLYFSYASSFNPALFGTSATRESFAPETGEQLESGLKADLIRDRLSSTLAFYTLRRSNVLISDPNNPLFNIQTGEQKSRGIELSLVGRPVNGWDTSLSYAYTDAFVSKDSTIPVGDRLTGAAKHQFGLWNSYQLQSGALRGLGFGLGLYDASIFYKRDKWKVQVGVNNLTNANIYNTLGFVIAPQPPLIVLGTISVEL